MEHPPVLSATREPQQGGALLREALTLLPPFVQQWCAFLFGENSRVDSARTAFSEASDALGELRAPVRTAQALRPHISGVSQSWSLLFMLLQRLQWYKVTTWLLVSMLSSSDGFLPERWREFFMLGQLLLESEWRLSLFLGSQCWPFALSQLRHVGVAWLTQFAAPRWFFYSVFTSYIEVAMNVLCDTGMTLAMLHDWSVQSRAVQRRRMLLACLRTGAFEVAPAGSG